MPLPGKKHHGMGEDRVMRRGSRRVRALLFALLRIGALVYVGFFLLLVAVQRRLMYFPARGAEPGLRDAAGAQDLLPWQDAAGALIGWRSRPPVGGAPRNRLIVFHGNAGHALDRTYFVNGFGALENGSLWEVFLFEYPGYGARPGSPSERAFVDAAQAALDSLRQGDPQATVAPRPVYLLGESLGGGVAAGLAARNPDGVAGLFLVTPFTSLGDVAAHHYPVFPVRPFLRDRYANDEALRSYHGPVAFLLTGRDEVVPLRLGRRLYDEYAGPKRLWMQENASHNAIDYTPGAPWWRDVSRFLLDRNS